MSVVMILILQQVTAQMVQLQFFHLLHQLDDYEESDFMMLLVLLNEIDETQVIEPTQEVYHQEHLHNIHLEDEDEIAETE